MNLRPEAKTSKTYRSGDAGGGGRGLHLQVSKVRADVRRFGLLPFTDSEAPSVVSIVAGGPISGSWWGHPAGQLIYQVSESLDADPDLLVLKLWREKMTLVHRLLWPALARIGKGHTDWQMDGLRQSELRLLAQIQRDPTARRDQQSLDSPTESLDDRHMLRVLEQRLLVLTRSVHTSTGAHALEAESWATWGARVHTPAFRGSISSAELAIENAARRLTPGVDPRRLLPWGRVPRTRRPARP